MKCLHALSAKRASSLSGVRAASSSGLSGSNAQANVGNNLLILAGMNKRSIHKPFLDGFVPARLKGHLDASVYLVSECICRKEQLFSSGKFKHSVYCFSILFYYFF